MVGQQLVAQLGSVWFGMVSTVSQSVTKAGIDYTIAVLEKEESKAWGVLLLQFKLHNYSDSLFKLFQAHKDAFPQTDLTAKTLLALKKLEYT